MSKIELQIRNKDIYHIIHVKGELDASSALSLDTTLQNSIDNGEKNILIDCTALQYISSPGIGVFTSRLDELENNKVTLVLFGMNDNVKTVFTILGLDQLLSIVSSEEDAKKLADGLQQNN